MKTQQGFSHTGKHVIIEIVEQIGEEFDVKNGFGIKDINPDNVKGLPKFQIQVLGKLKGNYFDVKGEEFLFNAFAHLESKAKGSVKAVIEHINVDTVFLTSMFLLDKQFQNIDITLTFENANDFKLYQMFKESMEEIKATYSETKTALSAMNKKGMLSFIQEAIMNRVSSVSKPSLEGKKALIIDTHNFYYRNYYGMPHMSNTSGQTTNVIKALTTLLKSLNKESYDYIVFASEGGSVKDSIRKEIFNDYKANRDETPEDLKSQILIADKLLKKIGLPVISVPGFEADDIIGSYVKFFKDRDIFVDILTTDKDMYQLVKDNEVHIKDPMKNKIIREAEVVEKFGVTPDKVVYALALAGDTSDNVPGVKGVGPKKAQQLLNDFGSLEGIYAHVEDLKGAVKKNIEENKDNAFMSLEMVQIYDHLARDRELKEFLYPNYNFFDLIQEDLEELEINV